MCMFLQIRRSLHNLSLAVKGLSLMSNDLEAVGTALFNGRVPDMWLKKSFPSLKPLGAYVKEVQDRVHFFQTWVDNGQPVNFWLSGFFFTQAFLTGSKQNYARKMKIPIDHIDFDFVVLDNEKDTRHRPEDGVFTHGLFLEGCKWDYVAHSLGESEPKVWILTSLWQAQYAHSIEVLATVLNVCSYTGSLYAYAMHSYAAQASFGIPKLPQLQLPALQDLCKTRNSEYHRALYQFCA